MFYWTYYNFGKWLSEWKIVLWDHFKIDEVIRKPAGLEDEEKCRAAVHSICYFVLEKSKILYNNDFTQNNDEMLVRLVENR